MSKIVEVPNALYERMRGWGSMKGQMRVLDAAPAVSSSSSPEVMRDKAASLVAQAKLAEDAAKARDKAEKAAEQARVKARAEKDATMARIGYHQALGTATLSLLESIKECVKTGGPVVPEKQFVQFRKELNPLAKSYGFAIVVVGDRTTATLVKE